MLGVKSNRNSIKGAFADKLREQFSNSPMDPQIDNGQVQAKPSEKSKK